MVRKCFFDPIYVTGEEWANRNIARHCQDWAGILRCYSSGVCKLANCTRFLNWSSPFLLFDTIVLILRPFVYIYIYMYILFIYLVFIYLLLFMYYYLFIYLLKVFIYYLILLFFQVLVIWILFFYFFIFVFIYLVPSAIAAAERFSRASSPR